MRQNPPKETDPYFESNRRKPEEVITKIAEHSKGVINFSGAKMVSEKVRF